MKKKIFVVIIAVFLLTAGIVYAQPNKGVLERIYDVLVEIKDNTTTAFGFNTDRSSAVELIISNLGGTSTSSDGLGIDVAPYKNLKMQCQSTSTPSMTIKVLGSLFDSVNNFDEYATQTESGETGADFILIYDKEDATGYDGDTGYVVSAAETRLFVVNTDGLGQIYATTTSYTSGSSTCWIRPFTNE